MITDRAVSKALSETVSLRRRCATLLIKFVLMGFFNQKEPYDDKRTAQSS